MVIVIIVIIVIGRGPQDITGYWMVPSHVHGLVKRYPFWSKIDQLAKGGRCPDRWSNALVKIQPTSFLQCQSEVYPERINKMPPSALYLLVHHRRPTFSHSLIISWHGGLIYI